MKLIERKYEKVNMRINGTDAFGNINWEWDWKTSYSINTKAIVAIVAMVLVVIGSVAAALVVTMSGNTNDIPAAVNTVVEETNATVMAQLNVYGPAYIKPNLYVCDTVVTSSEYGFADDTMVWSDGSQHDIDWQQLVDQQIVMIWSINDAGMRADFIRDIDLFNEYTHAGVRVENEGYVGQDNEFLVPVTVGEAEGGWAHMGLEFSYMGELFGIPEYVTITNAGLVYDSSMLEEGYYLGGNGVIQTGWAVNHTNTTLHEMGHLYGLAHTHDAPGEQMDSIMSYEADPVAHYLAGDIAGLQQVFCN